MSLKKKNLVNENDSPLYSLTAPCLPYFMQYIKRGNIISCTHETEMEGCWGEGQGEGKNTINVSIWIICTKVYEHFLYLPVAMLL